MTDEMDQHQDSSARPRGALIALAWGLIALGIALRIAQYAYNRSFWIDEACLALNIVGKSLTALMGPLDDSQNSPLAFLIVEKLVISVFGGSDWALRLFPLICGILSVPAFYVLVRRVAPEPRSAAPLVALAFFATAKLLIYYSSELRHYSADVLLVCVLSWFALSTPPHRDGASWRTWALALLGAVAVWFSLASIFVLASIATVHVALGLFRRDRRTLAVGVALGVLWAGLFFVHIQIQNANIAARHLEQEIEVGNAMSFMPLPPKSLTDFKWFREAFERVFYFPGGLTYQGLGAFAFLLGAAALWRTRRAELFLLLLPAVFALIASGLHRYPFRDRYILFLAPCVFLLIGCGIGALMDPRICRLRSAGVLLLAVLLAQPFVHGTRYLIHPRGGYEIKPLLAKLKADYRPGDVVYLPWSEQHAFLFYQRQFGLDSCAIAREPRDPVLAGTEPAYRASTIPALLKRAPRVWMLFGYDTRPPYTIAPGSTDALGLQEGAWTDDGTTLYLYRNASIDGGNAPRGELPGPAGSDNVSRPARP